MYCQQHGEISGLIFLGALPAEWNLFFTLQAEIFILRKEEKVLNGRILFSSALNMGKPKNRVVLGFLFFFFFPEKFPPSDLTQHWVLGGAAVPSRAAGQCFETWNISVAVSKAHPQMAAAASVPFKTPRCGLKVLRAVDISAGDTFWPCIENEVHLPLSSNQYYTDNKCNLFPWHFP